MGEVMVAMSEQLPFWVDANYAEAFAAAKAIALARDLGFCDIILERDSLNIVHYYRSMAIFYHKWWMPVYHCGSFKLSM